MEGPDIIRPCFCDLGRATAAYPSASRHFLPEGRAKGNGGPDGIRPLQYGRPPGDYHAQVSSHWLQYH